MKNVDVPMWDKGDSTDSYSKGGGSMFSDFESLSDKIPMVEEVYEKVLGRKPSSRELSLYKYSVLKREEITKKLLNSDEHKEIVEKGRTYPELEERERLAMSNILKLKHGIDDMKEEHDELKNILNEKQAVTIAERVKETPRSEDRMAIIDIARENPGKPSEEIFKIAHEHSMMKKNDNTCNPEGT